MKRVPKTVTKPHKESVRNEHVKTVASGLYDVGAVMDWCGKGHPCTTAYWTFEGEKHRIVISEECYQHVTRDPADIKASLPGYLKSLYRHERGHALYTVQDLDAVNEKADKLNVPFSLVNIFEDARIESLMRKKHKIRFRWVEWEKPALSEAEHYNDAIRIFQAIVQAENSMAIRKIVRDIRPWRTKSGRRVNGSTVHSFYKNAISERRCPGTMEIVGLAKRFMNWFDLEPSEVPGAVSGATGGKVGMKGGDMKQATEGSDKSPSKSSKGGPDKITPCGPRAPSKKKRRHSSYCGHQRDIDGRWPGDQEKHPLWSSYTPNRASSGVIRSALNSLTTQGRGKALSDHGRRVNMGSLSTLRITKLFDGKSDSNKAKPRLLVITDMSGSMSGSPHQNAMDINVGIAQSTGVDSTHVFTSRQGARKLESHQVTEEDLMKSGACSASEGIAEYLSRKSGNGLAASYDAILVITDGDLTDGVPDWEVLDRKGLTNVAACYVGEMNMSSNLKEHFRKHLSAKTVRDLAARIKQLLT